MKTIFVIDQGAALPLDCHIKMKERVEDGLIGESLMQERVMVR